MHRLTRPITLAGAALCVAMLALSPAPVAAQQVVVEGGAPNEGIGWDIFDDNRAATFFSVNDAVTFDMIRFWGILPGDTPYASNIFWQIFTDDGSVAGGAGAPTGVIAAGGVDATTSTVRTELSYATGFFSHQFDVAVSSQSLGAGAYWLTLYDQEFFGGPDGGTHSGLIWETTGAGGANRGQTFTIDENWYENGEVGLAFQLSGPGAVTVTPEPATLTLLAAGLLCLGAGVRRRRTR